MESTFYNGKMLTLDEFRKTVEGKMTEREYATELAWRFPQTSKVLVKALLGDNVERWKRRRRSV